MTKSAILAPRRILPGALFVTIRSSGDGARVMTRFEGEPLAAGPRVDKVAAERFRHVFRILDQPGLHHLRDALEVNIHNLSETLIVPMRAALDRCSEVVVVPQRDCLEMTLDLLTYRGRPLFLQRPISYRIGTTDNDRVVLDEQWSAFVVSNRETDPQRACRYITELTNAATYLDAKKVSVASLRREPPRDVAVLSLHGFISRGEGEFLLLGKEAVLATDFASLRPGLVYFDSCRLGVSWEFLKRFRGFGTRYYVAPAFSNEPGKSSTHTLRTFFGQLHQGVTPEVALFTTKRHLARRYEKDDLVKRLWRACPFRVYRLN